MRFIRGDSLREAIERFFQTDWSGKEGEKSLALRKLLGRFIDVCNAVEYAHSRGVLHRDLKPGNIMLGKYGETLVVDWGLAKAVGKHDPKSEETTLQPSSGSGSSPTQMGTALGTPAYMSPEQAAGRLDELGPGSDVYSLGATLYHVLTGKAPFAGMTDIGELLRDVRRGAFAPPRSVNQAVPRPLDAICLKAMALKPSDRYATPARLAEDIEHWLADEPTSAAAETFVERSSRFVRKHKSWALATAATIALVALVSTAAAVAINQQRETNATLADDNLNLANAEKSARYNADARRNEAEALAQEKVKLANEMRIELAKSAFAHGLTEYDSGRVGSADRDFVRGLALLTTDHDLRESFEQIACDRMTRSGRSRTPPLRHENRVVSAQFSADGKRVVTASWDNTARVWDAQTGAALGEPLRHKYPVRSAQFSPDGKRVVTASDADGTARVWDAQTGAALGEHLRHESQVRSAQFSPDGKRVVTASFDKTARVWDSQTGAALGEPLRHKNGVAFAQFSPDGKRVVTASGDQAARVWDAQSGTTIGEPLRHEEWVNFAEFSPDGKRVVTASLDNTARVWDAQSGAAIGEPLRHEGYVVSAQFSPDGKRVVTASYDGTARVWDAQTGAALGEPLRHKDAVESAQFSPDGNRVVTASDDGTARVWDAQTGAALGEPLRHGSEVNSAQFSPDGKRVVTASEDGTARVSDALTGAALGVPLRHESQVRSAQFSPDGKRVVTASGDKAARVWDLQTGAALGEPLRHESEVSSAQFSPDGKRVVTAGDDHTARIWDAQLVTPDRNWSLAALKVWTGLTADEQGRIRELTVQEWSALAAKFHSSNDPWPVAMRAWQRERFERDRKKATEEPTSAGDSKP